LNLLYYVVSTQIQINFNKINFYKKLPQIKSSSKRNVFNPNVLLSAAVQQKKLFGIEKSSEEFACSDESFSFQSSIYL